MISSSCDCTSASVNTQKIIQKQVRVPASLLTMNLGALSVVGSVKNIPLAGPNTYKANNGRSIAFAGVNQSQASDRNRLARS